MDILLCHSYFLAEDRVEREIMKPYPPLGLLYIASHLQSRGFQVGILDTTFKTVDQALGEINAAKAPVVGIHTNMMTRPHVLRLAAAARDGGATVVLGGPEAVNYPTEYLSRGADLIVAGEGELTLEELLPHVKSRGLTGLQDIAGLIFADDDGTPVRTPPRAPIRDLDGQPLPAREGIDFEQYLDTWARHHGVRSVSLITARGCPYTCRWCSHSVFGFSHRRRSSENVADEIEMLNRAHAPDQLWYADDVFTMNPKWLSRLAGELERRNLHIPFEAISREDRLNEDVIRVLKGMGCARIWVGAESGSQRVLEAMDRRTNAVRMRRVITMLKDHGIRTGTFIMVGYEGETWNDLNETRAHLVKSLPDEVLTTLAYPIKGTPYFAAVADKIMAPRTWATASDRDYGIEGRRTRRFYAHAQNWIKNEVRVAKAIRGREPRNMGALKAFLKAKRGRLGMYLTRGGRETAA